MNTAVNTVLISDEWKQAVTSELRSSVWKSRWPSWAPVPNKPTVSVDVKQHPTNQLVKISYVDLIRLLASPSGHDQKPQSASPRQPPSGSIAERAVL